MTWRHRLIARLARYLGVRVFFNVTPVPMPQFRVKYVPTERARGK